jgi:hypothetical protein
MRDTGKSWGYAARSGMRNAGRSMEDTQREIEIWGNPE